MAPEQICGSQASIGPPTDIYALGINLYELLTGRPPFKAETPTETMLDVLHTESIPPTRLQNRIPRDLETICLTAIARKPLQRYSSAAALAGDLDRFLDDRPILARPVSRSERIWRWIRRKPTLASAIGMGTVALLSLLGLWAQMTLQIRRERDTVHQTAATLDTERRQAVANFESAFRAIEGYMEEVTGNPLWGDDGSLEIRMELLKLGADFYEDLLVRNQSISLAPGAGLTREKIQLEQARLLFAVGKLQTITGAHEPSLASLEKAARVSYQALGPDGMPSLNEDAGLFGAIALSKARVLMQLDRPEQARDAAQVGLEYFQAVSAQEMLSEDYQNWYLAESWLALGTAQRRLGADQSRLARASLVHCQNHCERLPGIPDFLLTTAKCYLQLGRVARHSGDPEAAGKWIRQACETMDRLQTQTTGNQARYLATRAACHAELSDWHARHGSRDPSIRQLEDAIQAQRALTLLRPYPRECEQLARLEKIRAALLNGVPPTDPLE